MERYTIVATSANLGTISILVPCERQAKVGDLINKALGPLERAGASISGGHLSLKLGTADGPLLWADDALEHVVLDPSRERLVVSFQSTEPSGASRLGIFDRLSHILETAANTQYDS
jgi:N-terminal of Par3 and HAL proteins